MSMELQEQERFDDEQVQLTLELESRIESGNIDIDSIEEAIDNIDEFFDTPNLTGQDALDALNDFFGINDEQEEITGGSSIPQEEALGNYTKSELEARAREQERRDKQAASDELKAKQKEQADREIDTVADEMFGNIGTNDLFGGNPLADLGRAEKPKTTAEPKGDVADKVDGSHLFSKDDIPYKDAERAYMGISHSPEKRAQQGISRPNRREWIETALLPMHPQSQRRISRPNRRERIETQLKIR